QLSQTSGRQFMVHVLSWMGGLFVSAFAMGASAQVNPAAMGSQGPTRIDDGPRVALRHTFVADPALADASIVEETASLSSTPSSIALNAAGSLWSFPDNGEGWIGRAVALGNAGTQ